MTQQQDTRPGPAHRSSTPGGGIIAGLLGADGASRSLPTILGVAAAVLTLFAALIGIGIRDSTYEAESQVLVVPKATSLEGANNGADTLARGGVIDSLIAAYSGSSIRATAFRGAGITNDQLPLFSVTPQQVGQSSAIRFVAQSDDEELAVTAANAMLEIDAELQGYSVAFDTIELEQAEIATTVGASGNVLLVLALVFAIAAGLLVRWFVDRLMVDMPARSPRQAQARRPAPAPEAAAQRPSGSAPKTTTAAAGGNGEAPKSTDTEKTAPAGSTSTSAKAPENGGADAAESAERLSTRERLARQAGSQRKNRRRSTAKTKDGERSSATSSKAKRSGTAASKKSEGSASADKASKKPDAAE